MDGSVVPQSKLRWQGGYPQDSRERRCVELYKGRYYNWGCHNKAQFICQINTKRSCAAPSKTLLYCFKGSQSIDVFLEPENPCPDGWVSWGKSCFFLGQDKMDWFNAEQKCAEVTGSQLASCLTSEEATFLSFKVKEDDFYQDYFLGINDL